MKKMLLIFGAGGALGSGITEELKNSDYDKIYLFDRKELNNNQSNVSSIQIDDLSKEENVKDVFAKIDFDKDSTYFLYSTIGGFAGGNDVDEMAFEEWTKMINLNLNISFLIAKNFTEKVKSTKGGSICFTSAMTSLETAENKAAYGTSKNALNYLVKTLAREVRKYNISVNALAPLIIDTPENREWVKDDSLMINSQEIGSLVRSIFEHWRILSGNIVELPGTLS